MNIYLEAPNNRFVDSSFKLSNGENVACKTLPEQS